MSNSYNNMIQQNITSIKYQLALQIPIFCFLLRIWLLINQSLNHGFTVTTSRIGLFEFSLFLTEFMKDESVEKGFKNVFAKGAGGINARLLGWIFWFTFDGVAVQRDSFGDIRKISKMYYWLIISLRWRQEPRDGGQRQDGLEVRTGLVCSVIEVNFRQAVGFGSALKISKDQMTNQEPTELGIHSTNHLIPLCVSKYQVTFPTPFHVPSRNSSIFSDSQNSELSPPIEQTLFFKETQAKRGALPASIEQITDHLKQEVGSQQYLITFSSSNIIQIQFSVLIQTIQYPLYNYSYSRKLQLFIQLGDGPNRNPIIASGASDPGGIYSENYSGEDQAQTQSVFKGFFEKEGVGEPIVSEVHLHPLLIFILNIYSSRFHPFINSQNLSDLLFSPPLLRPPNCSRNHQEGEVYIVALCQEKGAIEQWATENLGSKRFFLALSTELVQKGEINIDSGFGIPYNRMGFLYNIRYFTKNSNLRPGIRLLNNHFAGSTRRRVRDSVTKKGSWNSAIRKSSIKSIL